MKRQLFTLHASWLAHKLQLLVYSTIQGYFGCSFTIVALSIVVVRLIFYIKFKKGSFLPITTYTVLEC